MNAEFNYMVRFPGEAGDLAIEDEYFILELEGEEHRIKLHDYAAIYQFPGLYEYVVCHKLCCQSHEVVAGLLLEEIRKSGLALSSIKAIDLGAGCGLAGEILRRNGVHSIIGIDMIPEAARAVKRDRPDVYEKYYVADVCSLDLSTRSELKLAHCTALVCASAMALGHITPGAFVNAFNLITDDGWVGFNILKASYEGFDDTGVDRFFSEISKAGCLEIIRENSYRHRLMMDGRPIENVAIVARKWKDL